MAEPSLDVTGSHRIERAADRIGQRINRPGCCRTQLLFYFAEHPLDRIQVRTGGGKIPHLGLRRTNQSFHCGRLVTAQIVHYHEVTRAECRQLTVSGFSNDRAARVRPPVDHARQGRADASSLYWHSSRPRRRDAGDRCQRTGVGTPHARRSVRAGPARRHVATFFSCDAQPPQGAIDGRDTAADSRGLGEFSECGVGSGRQRFA